MAGHRAAQERRVLELLLLLSGAAACAARILTQVDAAASLSAPSALPGPGLGPQGPTEALIPSGSETPVKLSAVSLSPYAKAAAAAPTVLDSVATGSTSGRTPAVIGVNLGHRYPGSNWLLWMHRLGVNGARIFLTSLWGSSLQSFVGGSSAWGLSLTGTPVNSLAQFQAAVADLRSPAGHNPAAAATWVNPVRWDKFDANWVTTDTSSSAGEQEGNHNATLAALRGLPGMNAPVVVIGCGLGSVRDALLLDNSAAYWAKSWEVYKHFYAFSRYLWLRGVTSIELYNEPDLDSSFKTPTGGLNSSMWTDTITLRSRAIQDLYADLNRESSSSSPGLSPDIHVGAYAKTTYGGGNLGQPGVQAQHQTFAAGAPTNASWFNFQTYSYHSYGQAGKTILSNFNTLLSDSAADRAAQGQFPFSLTEFNARTSGDYSSITANTDDAAEALKLASQALNLATVGANMTSLYVFKFSVTLSSGNGVTKNGIHWGDNTAAPYNIADTTLAAEAVRLIAEKLSGAKNIQTLNSAAASTLVDTKAIAVRDGPAYYVYVVNTGTSAITASLTLSGWGIPAGFPVFVDQVKADMYSEVTDVLTTTTNGAVSTPVAVNSLSRLTIPAAAATLRNVSAVQAAHVRAGAWSSTSYNSSTTMCVGTSSSNHSNTNASFMKFIVSNPGNITAAVLRLTLSNLSSNLATMMPMLLLAVPDNSLAAPNVTWTNLAGASGPLLPQPPPGAPAGWLLDAVAKNFINYNTPGLTVAGHVTLPALTTSAAPGVAKMVDVTSIVKASNGSVSFLLLRPFRRNREVASGDVMAADTLNNGTTACFHSLAAPVAANRPRLLLY